MMTEDAHPYLRLARLAVERRLQRQPAPNRQDAGGGDEIWDIRRACFVSIKTTAGDLRGCIGTILPTTPNIEREILQNAISSAFNDPRFPPLSQDELAGVCFSVDVLSEPEPVTDPSCLDPRIWGVIVRRGQRCGVLLPDLAGVDSVEEQLAIAARKAGIHGGTYEIERFSVKRYKGD